MFKGSGQFYTCVAILKVQVGGALGLWLGLGVLQLLQEVVPRILLFAGKYQTCGNV